MPIYEYECRACGHQFEQLVRTGDTPACPSCQGTGSPASALAQLGQHRAHPSGSFNKARARAKLVQRDKDVAQAEYEKKHHEEGH